MNRNLLHEFADPPSQYRAAPFWAWNDTLEPNELRRQIRLLKRAGMGGFFMHSRVGMATEYLSDDWFHCVDVCVDEARKQGMLAWVYDEDRWPSGAAGGLVTKNPRYRLRYLAVKTLSKPADMKWSKDVVAAFVATVRGTVATDVRRLARGGKPRRLARGERIIAFRLEVQEPGSWYNGQAYLDTLNPRAVAEFIEVTHEAYYERIGEHFGGLVPGIFTDEPNFGHGAREHIPWTGALPQVFRKRYGYDIRDHLMELSFDVNGQCVTPARYHYNDCRTHMFVDAFSRQVGQWCGEHNIGMTGHVLVEDTLTMQGSQVGSCLRFYEHMQIPGMDELTERWRIWDTAKQVASAANQFDRKWRLTETYGCTGWDFNFEGHKAVGDWQAAFGINIRCQHLPWYSMAGQRKRDYPASIFYQSPWWSHYRMVEDYFARIHAVMTRGREVRDLLVIHPVESAWLVAGTEAGDELDKAFIRVRDSLINGSIDFDYGDEEMLGRLGRVSRTAAGPRLRLAKAAYTAVLVPPMITIRSTTLELLRRFARAGGTVVFAGTPATYVDAIAGEEVAVLAATCKRAPARGPGLVRAIEAKTRRIAITDGRGRFIPGLPFLMKEDRDAVYLFVCNSSHTPAEINKGMIYEPRVCDRPRAYDDVRITGLAGCGGTPQELVPQTGDIFTADARRSGSGWEIRTSLPRLGSRLFVIPKVAGGQRRPKRPKRKTLRTTELKPKRWDITLSEPNVLVLDRPAWRVGDGPRRAPEEILRVDNAVREALGIQQRGGRMVQPWVTPAPADPRRVAVELTYAFDVDVIPSGELFLGIEHPDTFTVKLNGAAVPTDPDCGWWCDRTLRRIGLPAAQMHTGRNQLQLVCDYTETHDGLEIVYLLGDFGAAVDGTSVRMTAAPRSLRTGDWVTQGLPFYGGAVAYHRTIRPKLRKGERLIVQVPDYRGSVVRVLVDGRQTGLIAWEPREVDITDVVDGKGAPSDLAIEVISHRRNSHGPLHLNEKWPYWTGAGQFVTTGEQWIDGYQLVPCGLVKPPRLIVRK